MLKKFSFYFPTLGESVILVLLLLLGAVVLQVISFGLMLIPGMNSQAALNFILPISYVLMFIPPFMYAAHKGKKVLLKDSIHSSRSIPIDNNSFGKIGWILSALLVSVLTIAVALAFDPLYNLMPPAPEWLENALNTTLGQSKASGLIMAAILAPIFEETFCRGIILRGLLKRTSTFMAIFWSAIFFGLIHMNPWQALPAFVMGLVFGWIYYKTGSLKLTMLMHFVNNFCSLLLMWNFPQLSQADSSFSDILPQGTYWYSVGGGALVCILIFVILAYSWKDMRITKRNR